MVHISDDMPRPERIRKALAFLTSQSWYTQKPTATHIGFLARIPGLTKNELKQYLQEDLINGNL